MKVRLLVLLFLLLSCTIIGLLFSPRLEKGRHILVAGNITKTDQNDGKCITEISYIFAENIGRCAYQVGEYVSVSGRVEDSLIEKFKFKIQLSEAEIISIRQTGKRSFFDRVVFENINKFRDYCRGVYRSFLPKDESALVAGIVLGDKEDIGYDFYQKMIKSGSVHIVVASGFNLMLLTGMVMSLGFWFGGRLIVSLVSLLILYFYAVLTGMEPPVIRAWLMVLVLLVSQYLGRKQSGWWILFLSVWIMLVWDISLLWSISFQLSVAASIGLMVFAPFVVAHAEQKGLGKEFEWLERFSIVSTVAVMFLTVPIIWFHFGRVSLIGLLSNILILPLVPPVMILGALMLVAPSVFFMPTYALVHLIVKLIYFFGS